ncbi:hypothetical protein ACI7YT_12315 [Microbacterium sp. M]|uniref:hypothetical protein n=1 Tax=Microbacterium sp. M TaxID=3377125 RepID=UPI00386BC175
MSIAQDEFVIAFDGTTVEEGGNAKPLPDGTKVLVTIVPTRKDSPSIEKRPFAKQGPNAGITALAVQLRISEGQRGTNRRVFSNVPLARQIFSSKKNAPVPAYDFFGFFRALGYDVDAPEGFRLPADRELLGKSLEVVLGIEVDQEGNERNNVKFFNKANGIPAQSAASAPAATSAAPAAVSAAAWTPGAPVAQEPLAAPAGQPAWMVQPQEAQAAQGLQQAAQASQGF